jgi:predicted DNA-binding transcriptional regulator YafY
MYPNTLFLARLRSLTGAPSTDKALAETLGIARSKVVGWNAGTLHPTVAAFAKIRAALGQRATVQLFLAALADAITETKRLESEAARASTTTRDRHVPG